jgi:hypothetical protein
VRHAVDSRCRRIDSFFARASAENIDEEISSDLARYGAILASGYVERCIEVIILDRLQTRAQPRVLQFVKSWFKKGSNYDCEAIYQLLMRFDVDWGAKFKTFTEGNPELIESMTSIYTLRNSVAHGGDQNRGLKGVKTLFEDAKIVIEGVIDATI